MGILNVTPDSFSDGGTNENIEDVLKKVGFWLGAGVDIIDIGGESTRPGSLGVSEQEEIDRTLPLIEKIIKTYPDAFISIDTMKYHVAKAAAKAGAQMINDISGLQNDPRIAELAAKENLELVVMHLPEKPLLMQINPHYDNLIEEVYEFLSRQIEFAKSCGVKTIYADVGIGFGKTFEDNWTLLRNLSRFENLGSGLLLGISRKKFLGSYFEIENPADRDWATMLLHSLMMNKNIDIIRVHNPELALKMRQLSNKMK